MNTFKQIGGVLISRIVVACIVIPFVFTIIVPAAYSQTVSGSITSAVPWVNSVENETRYDPGDTIKTKVQATATNNTTVDQFVQLIALIRANPTQTIVADVSHGILIAPGQTFSGFSCIPAYVVPTEGYKDSYSTYAYLTWIVDDDLKILLHAKSDVIHQINE